jgi:hypothetical protein
MQRKYNVLIYGKLLIINKKIRDENQSIKNFPTANFSHARPNLPPVGGQARLGRK